MGWQDRYEAYLQKNKEEEQQKKREQQRRNPVTTNEQGNSSLKRYTEWKLRTGRIQEDVAARVEALAGADENFYTAYASRFGNRNGTDGGKYISDAAEQYQSAMQQRKQFDIKADSILQALDQYGEYFDQDWAASVRDYLGKARTNQDNMLLDYAADSRYWAQFGNEEGYLRYLNPEKYGRQDRQAQYAANNQRIEELKKQKAAVKRPENGYLTGGAMPQSSPYGAALQAPKKDPADNEITMLETWNRNYERGNGDYSKVIDDYATIAERDDFKTVSAKRNYDNPTREDLFNYDRSVSEGNLALTNGGSFDDLGNIVDREGNVVQLADGGKIHDRLGLYLSASEEDKAEAYNLLSASNGNYTNTWANLIQTGDEGSWNQLSENEVAIYYYLLNNDGQETADKYLDDMKVELNRRQTQRESQEQAKNLAEAGTLKKAMLNVATTPARLLGGAVGFADDAINLIQGKDINPYSSRHALFNFGDTIREAQAAELEAVTNGAAIPFVNYTLGDLYQSGMSFVDTRVGGLLGPNTYMALMGMGSASAEAKKLYEQGASNMEIAWGGALAGAAEMIFEKVSIDKLIDIKDPKTGWDIVKNILIQGGVEASEEVATEIANTITNALVMTDRSDWARLVEENNGDEFAAFKAKVADVGKAALGGFFSGAGSGGTYSVERYVAGQRQSAQTGQYIDEHLYGTDALMALAEEVAGYAPPKLQGRLEAQSEKLHDAVYDGNGNRGKAAGKLYGTVRTAITQQNQADIAKGLQELEGPEGKRFTPRQARAIAEAAAASMNGEKLTERQQKTLDRFQSDSSVRDVVMKVAGGEQAARLDAFHAAIATDNAKAFRGSAQAVAQGATQTAPWAAEQADAQTPGNVYGTEKTPSQGRYEVSDSGSAQLLHTGEPVSIRSVAEIRDGKMTLELKDGRKVSAEEISYASEDEALVYEAVADMGVNAETANVLLGAYHTDSEVSAEAYSLGIKEAYKYGQYNFPMQEVVNGPFSSMLTDHQRNTAYRLGQMFSEKLVAEAQARVRTNRVFGKTASITGRVHFDGDRNSLTERQRESIAALEIVADALGVQVYVYESKADENGRRMEANGWYDPKDGSIHIDLHAGANGESTMLFTAAHELTHHIKQWSPAKFKTLSDFLMNEYGQKGVNVESLVQLQIAKAKRNGRDISYDVAYEEVVADSMESMLADGNLVEKLAKLKQRDKTLWQKIKEYIRELVSKIRKVYDGLSPDSVEGRFVAEMKEATERLQDMFGEALTDASENYRSSLTPGEEGVVSNRFGDPVAHSTEDGMIRLSMRTYEEDGRKALWDYLNKCVSGNRITKSEMQEMLDGIEEIYKVCKEFKDKYAPFSSWSDAAVIRDTYGKPVFSVVTPNGDYKMNMDFSLVCKKRRTLDAVFNEMSRRGIIDDYELGQKSVVKINEIIRQHGLETACALCFVDAKRFRQASMADSFINLYNELVESLVPEDQRGNIGYFNFSGYETIKKIEGGIDTWTNSKLDFSHLNEVMRKYGKGTVEHKAAKYIKTHPEGRKLLLRGDFMSSRGFDAVKTRNRDILKLYNSKKGTGGPKAAFGDVQYMNEIIKKARSWTPEKAYSVGGVRIQSFSDYVPRMVFDYTQMIYDLAATKLPAHAYTKEALFAKQFGLTGVKINMSLIPAIAENGIAPGLDANGDYVWAGESFDFETAKKIQNAEGYTENCGTICVGVSNEHIRKLLRDPNIRMVIPYHKSGLNPIVAHMNKIAEFTDYTKDQRTKGKDGKALSKDFDFSKALHDMGKQASPKAVADQYLKWCIVNGYSPRFAEFASEDNYYKLLEDFTLYDKDGNYVPQREVRAVFPKVESEFGSMKDLIQEGLQEDAIVEGKRDKNLSAIVDEIQRTIPKAEADISENQVNQADRDLEAEHYRWSDRDTESVSNRSLLANALEGAAKNDTERERIQEYKSKIDRINAEERRLHTLNKRIKELSFAGGAKDSKVIHNLRTEAKQIANRISIYDKQLLRLEASQPLQDVLAREKKAAYKRAEQKGREAVKAYSSMVKERTDVKKQRAIVERQVKDLTKMIVNPTKDAHVPTVLHKPLQKLLDSIDFTSERSAEGGEATVRDVAYTRALQSIRTAIAAQRTAMEGVEDGAFALDVPPEFLDKIDGHIKMINDATEGMDLTTNRVYDMSADELKDLAYLLGTINKAVRNIDKLHMEGAKARVSELAESTVREMGQRKPVKGEDGGGLMWANYTPTYAFERMGTAATQILDGLKQGQAKMARTVDGVLQFAAKTYDAKEVKAWQEKIHTVKLESGETVKLTTAQIMSFYCLSNRDQGVGHLTGGGIRVGTIGEGPGKTVQKQHFRLTVQDINQINGLLDKRQLDVAKAMQKYMQDVGGRLGNEISMARWGFMQMTEENYFPIRSDSDVHDGKNPDQEKANLWALLNKSFTKSVTKGANDAVIVSSIFDVFADHMAEMAEYNAFALPLVDAMKWYNYRSTTRMDGSQIETVGVKKSLNDTLGTAAGKYFIDLMTDINSSQKGGRHEDIMGKLLSYSKASAVGWNLRVAIQQPTAILRASLYLDMPDLARGSLRIGTKELAEEMQKYSGIAMWKSLGYYDLNVSRSVREQIKGNTNLVDTFNEWGMWLPGKVDEITWARIWAACKSKVSRTQNLKGEALLKETAKLFDDVVYHTQVVDSVLTKSSLMRSKSQIMKEFTSFMSEPTVSVNILMSAFQDYRQGKTKWEKAKRTFAICFKGYALSAMANALVTAFADAFRDDDEYEEFWEKYQQALLGEKFVDGNLIAELNPLEKLVFVKDALSLMRGYDVQNAYIKLVKGFIDLVNDIKKYLEGKGSITEYGVIYNALKVLGNFTGAAPANLMREVVTIWNNTFGKLSGKKIHRYQTGVKDGIHNAFDAGTLTAEEAIRELVLAQEAENEDEAYFQVKKWETGEDSKYDGLYEALEKNEGVDAAVKELTDHGVKEKDAQEQIWKKLKTWYTDPESEIQMSRKDILSRLKKYAGLDRDEAEEVVKKWDMEKETGFTYDGLREQYVEGNISEKEAISYMQKYGGKTKEEAQDQMEDWTKNRFFDGEINADKAAKVLTNHCGWEKADAENKVRYWDFKRSHPDLYVDDAWLDEYDIEIRESGIALEVFIAYRNKVKSITGEGKKDRRMDVIDSLPITDEQKDAIYFAEGWAESTLNEASWHQR